ncbi:unnamed protein product, partial [Effrenium voratum]
MFDFDELEEAQAAAPKPEEAPALAEAQGPAREPAEAGEPGSAETGQETRAKEVEAPDRPEPAQEPAQELAEPEPPVAQEPVQAVRPQGEAPNAKYSPGMFLECVSTVLMRQHEDLDSPQLARLPASTLVE